MHIYNSHQPMLNQKLQKSMALSTLKKQLKTKYENTTMCIVHRPLLDATTPYTERYALLNKN